MSLADELLADLEEAGDEGEDGLYPEEDEGDSDGEVSHGRADGGLEDIPEEMEVDYSKTESVRSIAKLRNSKQVSPPVRAQIFRVPLHFWLSLCDLFIRLFFFLSQFSEIMDKISGYIGKQRKNSEGEFDFSPPPFVFPPEDFQ